MTTGWLNAEEKGKTVVIGNEVTEKECNSAVKGAVVTPSEIGFGQQRTAEK